MAMSEKSRKVLEYLKAHNDENLTAAEVAEAIGYEKRTVDGVFTSAFQRKGHGERIPAEREEPDGSHTKIKVLHLTDSGMALDPDAEE